MDLAKYFRFCLLEGHLWCGEPRDIALMDAQGNFMDLPCRSWHCLRCTLQYAIIRPRDDSRPPRRGGFLKALKGVLKWI